MVSEQTRATADDIKNYIKQNGIDYQSLYDLLDVAKVAFEKENDTEWALKVTSYIKDCCKWAIQNSIEVLQIQRTRMVQESLPAWLMMQFMKSVTWWKSSMVPRKKMA